jgi:hypothetical protein
MAVGKCVALRGIEVSQDKRHLTTKLRAERVDDALELGAVRSPR